MFMTEWFANKLHVCKPITSFEEIKAKNKSCSVGNWRVEVLWWILIHACNICDGFYPFRNVSEMWWFLAITKELALPRKYLIECYMLMPLLLLPVIILRTVPLGLAAVVCLARWGYTGNHFGSSCHHSLPVLFPATGTQCRHEKLDMLSVTNTVHLCCRIIWHLWCAAIWMSNILEAYSWRQNSCSFFLLTNQ